MKPIYVVTKNKLNKISLVKHPAIMTAFVKFAEDKKEIEFKFQDDEKRIVSGPVLIPDQLIWRTALDGWMKFDKTGIEEVSQSFMLNSKTSSINIEHTSEDANAFISEIWLSGNNDKSKDWGYNLPEGTLFMSVKITDDELWSRVKSGEFTGFSAEGFADLILEGFDTELKNEKNEKINLNMENMLKDGGMIYSAETPIVDTLVFTDAEMTIPVADGEWLLESGETLVVVDGKVTEVKPKVEAEEEVKIEVEMNVETELATLKTEYSNLNTKYDEVMNLVNGLIEAVKVLEADKAKMESQAVVMNEQILKLSTNIPQSSTKKNYVLSAEDLEEIEKKKLEKHKAIIEFIKNSKK